MNGTARACCEWEIRDGVPCGRTDLAVDGEARICFIHIDRWIDGRNKTKPGGRGPGSSELSTRVHPTTSDRDLTDLRAASSAAARSHDGATCDG